MPTSPRRPRPDRESRQPPPGHPEWVPDRGRGSRESPTPGNANPRTTDPEWVPEPDLQTALVAPSGCSRAHPRRSPPTPFARGLPGPAVSASALFGGETPESPITHLLARRRSSRSGRGRTAWKRPRAPGGTPWRPRRVSLRPARCRAGRTAGQRVGGTGSVRPSWPRTHGPRKAGYSPTLLECPARGPLKMRFGPLSSLKAA